MKGFDENKLLSLCDEKYVHNGYSNWTYWTSEIYSFGKHLREYGFFPRILPLYIYTDHGPASMLTNEPAPNELESDACCQFYHSLYLVKKWKEISSKPCYVLYSPFVFCRKKKKIEKSPNAKGTLVFPAHSTQSVEDISNIEEYIEQLKNLPEKFHPISACIHMHDIRKGLHKVFMKHEIPVYTVGHTCDYRFAERFYNLLKNFKYSTSNMIGSYTYYSVEMGIPFSIYGNQPKYINKDNPNIKIGNFDAYTEFSQCKIIYDLFDGLFEEITEEQKKLVERDLGLIDGVSRLEMAKILYLAFFKQLNIKDLFQPFVKYSKRPRLIIKQLKYELLKSDN